MTHYLRLATVIAMTALLSLHGADALAVKGKGGKGNGKGSAQPKPAAGATNPRPTQEALAPSKGPTPGTSETSEATKAPSEKSGAPASEGTGGKPKTLLQAAKATIARRLGPSPSRQRAALRALVRNALKKSTFYHATATENLDGPSGIRETGLDPAYGGKTGASSVVSGELGEAFQNESKKSVHVTNEKTAKKFYKPIIRNPRRFDPKSTKPGRDATTLKVIVGKDIPLGKDPHDSRAVKTDQRIPPENIRESHQPGSDEYHRAMYAAIRSHLPSQHQHLSDKEIEELLKEDGYDTDDSMSSIEGD